MAAYDQFDDLALHLPLEAVLPVFATTDTAHVTQTAMHTLWNPEGIILWLLDLGGISAHRFTSESYSVNSYFPLHYFLLPLPTLPASRPMISAATAIRKITRKPFPRLFGLGVAVPTVIWGLLAKRRPIRAIIDTTSTWFWPGAGGGVLGPTAPSVRKFVP